MGLRVQQLVEQVAEAARWMWGARSPSISCSADPVWADARPSAIERVLLWGCACAVDARATRVELRAFATDLAEGDVAGLAPGAYIAIEVADNGGGWRTAAPVLAAARAAAVLELDTTPGMGATLRSWWPEWQAHGRRNVLVVDPDPVARRHACLALRGAGRQVLALATAPAAADELVARGARCEGMVVAAELEGAAALRRIAAATAPHAGIVCTARDGAGFPGLPLVVAPYLPRALEVALRAALPDRPAPADAPSATPAAQRTAAG